MISKKVSKFQIQNFKKKIEFDIEFEFKFEFEYKNKKNLKSKFDYFSQFFHNFFATN
jgi:hypothetical protein